MNKSKNPIRFAIVDDHQIFRQGLKMILQPYKNLSFVFEAENGNELLDKLAEHEVDIVLLDLSMEGMNGLVATKFVNEKYPNTHVLILSMQDEPNMIAHAIQQGASGYILKNSDPKQIALAMETIMESGYYFNEVVTPASYKKILLEKHKKPSFKTLADLTEREIQVLILLCEEKTSQQISEEIHLSPRTVEGIRTSLMAKIGAKNLAGLVSFAFRNGLV
ncbi:MAG TPA: response regulator transcription factor [Flavobacteriales bacterium]